MTPAEHATQREAVLRSLLLGTTRAERHGVYARRKPVVAPVVPEPHRYRLPVVRPL